MRKPPITKRRARKAVTRLLDALDRLLKASDSARHAYKELLETAEQQQADGQEGQQ